MAYDTYGRPLRGNGDPGYFGTHDSIPDYANYYSSEPRDNPSFRRRPSPDLQHRSSPTLSEPKMSTAPDYTDLGGLEGVSPEVIAALTKKITESVKREVVEHLKQSGTVDDQARAPPMQRDPSNKSNSTSSPPLTARKVYTPPSPTQSVKTMYAAPQSDDPVHTSARSPPGSPLERPSGVRFSDRSLPTRPSTGRSYSTVELSTIDHKWGRLFGDDGNPTKRLGQFLRGLANHIIDCFPPMGSIVVTPAKMAKFYADHPVEKEPHPLLTIFRAQSNEHISQLYQDLGCQHFLIQENSNSPPTIPALTPTGFAHWMTIHIMAHPDEEWRRLEGVVLAMPIDADGCLVERKPERLPKQISRHLLPEKEDRKSRKLLDDAILTFLDDLGSAPRRKASLTSSPPVGRRPSVSQSRSRPVEIHQARTSPTTAKAQPIERERKPYGGAPAPENEEVIKIERDRQPYIAQPGTGKVYTENVNLNIPSRPGRANSISTRTSGREQSTNTDSEPRQGRGHSNSTAGQAYAPGTSRTGGRRTSSPPLKNFRHTSPEDINIASKYGPNPSSSNSSFTNQSQTFSPGSFSSANSFPPPPPGPPPVETRDAHRRSRDERQYKRNIDEDLRFAGEMNSPRDAEKFDRYQESRGEADRYDRAYERGPTSIDPRDRGAPIEEWYRKDGRGTDYESYRRY